MAVSFSPVRIPSPSLRRARDAWAAPVHHKPRTRWGPWRRTRRAAPLLGEVPPFGRYPADVVEGLSRYADRLRVPEGMVVATRGHGAREAIVVLAGEVRTQPPTSRGRALGPGSWVGPRQILCSEPHEQTLLAGPGLEVVVLNGPAYRWAAANLPGLADDTT